MPRSCLTMNQVIQAISIKYNNRVYEMKQNGIDVTVLSLGEAFFDIPLYTFDDLPFPDLYHYSHSRGLIGLRRKLSEYFGTEYDFHFDPTKNIIVTAGSKVAIYMGLMSIINPGDEVIILEPYWVSYTEQVKLCYGVPVTVGYDHPVDKIEEYVTSKTRCIILNNPQNPTGKVYSRSDLEYLYALAVKNDIYILSDEAYSDFAPSNTKFYSLGCIDRSLNNTVVCNSISKNYGISGWRMGYIISNAKKVDEVLKINQHLVTCPSTILEMYIEKHFDDIIRITKPQIADLLEKRLQVVTMLERYGIGYLPGTAAFYLFASIHPSKLTSIPFADILLDENHICVVPGIGYGGSCDGFVRISFGTESLERIEKGIFAMRKLIDKTTA
ncbi:pyridoxal phosphate-dependent aminotransferase [bacterium]|nr:pyridoxal phosphate-dependent aminotransferase [bacterium]